MSTGDLLCDERTVMSRDGRIAVMDGMAYDATLPLAHPALCLGPLAEIDPAPCGHCSSCGAPRGLTRRCLFCGTVAAREVRE